MESWDFCRSVTSVQILVALGEEFGARQANLLNDTGLDAVSLYNPESVVEARSEMTVIRNLLSELPDIAGLGLLAGERYHLSAYGIWGFALASSPSVRKTVELSQTYQELTFVFAGFTVKEDGEYASLVFDNSDVPADISLFSIEREILAAMVILRELLGAELGPEWVTFQHPRPAYGDLYDTCFNGQVTFSAPRNELIFPRRLLDMPRVQGNGATASLLDKQCSELIAQRTARKGVSGKVRDILLRRRPMSMDMELVADTLCMTSRTLRRKLQSEGTSFRQLVDEIRMTLAEEMLTGTRLGVEQIAERLCYADASSFSQAFKRMSGKTPSTVRKQGQGS
ncbi:putative HTH-type transcriptional regulator [Zhongshania aliphaticivorans]|uniref:Putative HTH-type transcriptional regulator n=1 Tax=Zhongshania aliphaticivorans TaxID=1470434 RepID=A0A5S9PIJ3_9GAMM|nr:AraC family transcriptional regulator [Zhongshania aliphaticivorans]CAA0103940.1 putative HTH-type transcriptional regulator [Zhongshania aliphaticivorans]